MEIVQTELPGVLEINPEIHKDARGKFAEIYRHDLVEEMAGKRITWKQGNVSHSVPRTLRGLHYSLAPEGQDKYVTCLSGLVWDIVLDVREGSPTFGEWQAFVLSGSTFKSVYIPTGYAHGFVVIADEPAVVSYQVSSAYAPEHERAINPFDPTIALGWTMVASPVLSDKDRDAPTLKEAHARGMLPRYIDTTPEEE